MKTTNANLTQKVRILLVEDDRTLGNGLHSVLEKEADFEVVAEAANGRETLELAQKEKPDIVIMDVAMLNLNGIEAATEIRTLLPRARVIALAVHSDKNYMIGMLRAGTVGYLLKDCASEELVKAIRSVIAGKAYVTFEVAPLILEDYSGKASLKTSEQVLNAKEIKVLQLLASGMNSRDIAERMQVCGKTIDRNRAQIMEKLNLFSVAELTKYAVREGISPLS